MSATQDILITTNTYFFFTFVCRLNVLIMFIFKYILITKLEDVSVIMM